MLKKYIAGLFLSGIFTLPAFAATNDEILARLESLERSLKEVKSENAALKRKLRTESVVVSATPATPVRSSPSDAMAMVQPYAKVPVTTYDWSGLYVGVQGGGANVMPRAGAYNTGNSLSFQSLDRNVFGVVGGYAGGNLQFGTLVVGLDGQWSYFHRAESIGEIGSGGTTAFSRIRETATLRARLGAAIDGDLFYFAGGPSWAKSEFGLFSSTNGGVTSGTVSGYSLAGGWEHRFGSNWIMRTQVQYSDYQSQRIQINSSIYGQQISLIEATLGLSYKFNPFY